MRIIAVMSPKGGIGKTTTSDAIAYMLGEEQEKRVLILDGDPQGDTSKTFEACGNHLYGGQQLAAGKYPSQ